MNRTTALNFLFRFLSEIPYLGRDALGPNLILEWQLHPQTVQTLQEARAFDPDNSPGAPMTLGGNPVFVSSSFPPGRLRLAIVSNIQQ